MLLNLFLAILLKFLEEVVDQERKNKEEEKKAKEEKRRKNLEDKEKAIAIDKKQ